MSLGDPSKLEKLPFHTAPSPLHHSVALQFLEAQSLEEEKFLHLWLLEPGADAQAVPGQKAHHGADAHAVPGEKVHHGADAQAVPGEKLCQPAAWGGKVPLVHALPLVAIAHAMVLLAGQPLAPTIASQPFLLGCHLVLHHEAHPLAHPLMKMRQLGRKLLVEPQVHWLCKSQKIGSTEIPKLDRNKIAKTKKQGGVETRRLWR